IRDFHVTGVQTCALPISRIVRAGPDDPELFRAIPISRDWQVSCEVLAPAGAHRSLRILLSPLGRGLDIPGLPPDMFPGIARDSRSEERRVGEERRPRGPA